MLKKSSSTIKKSLVETVNKKTLMKTNMITISLWDLEMEESILCSISPSQYLVLYLRKNLYFMKEQLKTVYEKIKVREIIYSSELYLLGMLLHLSNNYI